MPGRFEEWLDGIDAVATTIYVVLIAVVVGTVCGVMFYIVRHWQPSWGTQGEGFYLAVAFLLVIGWAMGQLAWLILRHRGSAWTAHSGPVDVTGDHDGQSGDSDSGHGASPGGESSDQGQ